jgi:hypothetical protein
MRPALARRPKLFASNVERLINSSLIRKLLQDRSGPGKLECGLRPVGAIGAYAPEGMGKNVKVN